jgi:glutaredoxin-like YruB-family protein
MVKVTVYSTSTCPWCHKAKDFLKEKKIEFEDKNVAEDEEARNKMIEESGQSGVPVISIEGHDAIVGFDVEAITAALGLKE